MSELSVVREVSGARASSGREGSHGGLTVRQVAVDNLDAAQLAQWTALHRAQTGVANPFCSPTWVTGWYRHYVDSRDRVLLWVTEQDRLVGVAPMYRQDLAVAGVRVARRLAPVGSGRSTPLEIPPLLCAPGRGRAVGRAVVPAVLRPGVTWAELCVSREHGWLAAQEASAQDGRAAFARHQQIRACVVLPLESTWDETRAALKRNVKESVRRAHNRLVRDGRPVQVHHRTGDQLDAAVVRRLLALHAARSGYHDTSSEHRNAFADPVAAAFLLDVLPKLGREGEASVVELELAGDVVAAQLVLHPPGSVYFHSSGFRPQEWTLSPVTTLQVEAMRRAIERGETWVNFSPGPNEAKLRWSDRLHVYDDVAFGPVGHGRLARYSAFFLAKDVRQLRHESKLEVRALAARAAAAKPARA